MSEFAAPQPGSSGLPDFRTEDASLNGEPGKQKLFRILLSLVLFGAGLAAGFGWYSFRNSEDVRPIERKLLLEILITDKNCDSGIDSGWFDGAFLANESGKKIQTLTGAVFDFECSKDSEILSVYYIVKPTDSWIYRIVLFNTQDMSRDAVLKSTTVVKGREGTGIPEFDVFISTDCSGKERLCE